MFEVYTDGAYNPVPKKGGWAAVVVEDGRKSVYSGFVEGTTSNRMEITAALEGILHTPPGAEVVVHTDSQYLFGSMTRGWQRRANLDLWEQLDEEVTKRKVRWEWLAGDDTNPYHKQAHALATSLAAPGKTLPVTGEPAEAPGLTHIDAEGRPRMVDVTAKPETGREAVARGRVMMKPATLELIQKRAVAKGDVLAVAQLAGIMAAKQTPYLIPLCHPVLVGDVRVEFKVDEKESAVDITAAVKSTGRTGVEMEALTAVAIAALTIYDMCKAVDRGIRMGEIRLLRKSGGKSGAITLEPE